MLASYSVFPRSCVRSNFGVRSEAIMRLKAEKNNLHSKGKEGDGRNLITSGQLIIYRHRRGIGGVENQGSAPWPANNTIRACIAHVSVPWIMKMTILSLGWSLNQVSIEMVVPCIEPASIIRVLLLINIKYNPTSGLWLLTPMKLSVRFNSWLRVAARLRISIVVADLYEDSMQDLLHSATSGYERKSQDQ